MVLDGRAEYRPHPNFLSIASKGDRRLIPENDLRDQRKIINLWLCSFHQRMKILRWSLDSLVKAEYLPYSFSKNVPIFPKAKMFPLDGKDFPKKPGIGSVSENFGKDRERPQRPVSWKTQNSGCETQRDLGTGRLCPLALGTGHSFLC